MDEQYLSNLAKFLRRLPSLNGHSSAPRGAIDLFLSANCWSWMLKYLKNSTWGLRYGNLKMNYWNPSLCPNFETKLMVTLLKRDSSAPGAQLTQILWFPLECCQMLMLGTRGGYNLIINSLLPLTTEAISIRNQSRWFAVVVLRSKVVLEF